MWAPHLHTRAHPAQPCTCLSGPQVCCFPVSEVFNAVQVGGGGSQRTALRDVPCRCSHALPHGALVRLPRLPLPVPPQDQVSRFSRLSDMLDVAISPDASDAWPYSYPQVGRQEHGGCTIRLQGLWCLRREETVVTCAPVRPRQMVSWALVPADDEMLR